MHADQLTWAFVVALLVSLALRLWLALRQLRHLAHSRAAVPAAFAGVVQLAAHYKAVDYSAAKLRFGLAEMALSALVLLAWTLLGGLSALNQWLLAAVLPGWGAMAYQLALLGAFALIGMLVELPLDAWRTWLVEQRFGFNRSSLGLFLADALKGALVGVVVGAPLAALLLWVMQAGGRWWWLAAWALWGGFVLLMQLLWPTLIAPLFNRFVPLADPALEARVRALMQRCGFAAKGLFVMDAGRRSAHGNAYFAGLGAAKRVVFFDTLLARLQPAEVEAVLAHELGHFHHRHVLRRLLLLLAASLLGFALLGWLAAQPAFYEGLGVAPNLAAPNGALALLLFMLALPPFVFFAAPLAAASSRRAEFQADAYAAGHTSAAALRAALVKLYQDNASALSSDALYARCYHSHPPAAERLAALVRLGAAA